MRTNYHTHTERCNHAKGSDEEFVLSAIRGGYNLLGFADHIEWPRETKERLELDYMLLGHHFVYDERTSPRLADTVTRKDLELYIRSSIEAMEEEFEIEITEDTAEKITKVGEAVAYLRN